MGRRARTHSVILVRPSMTVRRRFERPSTMDAASSWGAPDAKSHWTSVSYMPSGCSLAGRGQTLDGRSQGVDGHSHALDALSQTVAVRSQSMAGHVQTLDAGGHALDGRSHALDAPGHPRSGQGQDMAAHGQGVPGPCFTQETGQKHRPTSSDDPSPAPGGKCPFRSCENGRPPRL